jgi:polyisoprenoid-binding protein YceI
MKNNKILLAYLAGILTIGILLHSVSCTREDQVIGTIDPPNFTYGTATVKTSEGWVFNKTHSSVLWETDYLGVSALLTGRFNSFDAKAEFTEDHPETSTLSGWVVLSSVNTGEPGRDGGCLLVTFGTTVDDTAKFVTTSIAFDNQGGYIAHADLDFHGVKKDITMQLTYTKATRFDENSGIGGAPFTIAGLSGQFEINAKTDFGIVSTSIADRVRVKISCQFKKAG